MADYNNAVTKTEIAKTLATEPLLGYIRHLREEVILAQAYSVVDLSGKTSAEMQLIASMELKGKLLLCDDLLELAKEAIKLNANQKEN